MSARERRLSYAQFLTQLETPSLPSILGVRSIKTGIKTSTKRASPTIFGGEMSLRIEARINKGLLLDAQGSRTLDLF